MGLAQQKVEMDGTRLGPFSVYNISLLSPSQVCAVDCGLWGPVSVGEECHLPSDLLAWPLPREDIEAL